MAGYILRRSPHPTRFKKGNRSWHPEKPYWSPDWLRREYVERQRTAAEIAAECGCWQSTILFRLRQFGIPTRTATRAATKHRWFGRDWLHQEYIDRRRSAMEIATACGCSEPTVLRALRRFAIPRRTVHETRAVKRWGSDGERNPMFGRSGEKNPNWKGGITPFRERIYSSLEWKRVARSVRVRDSACRLCGSLAKWHIHHITPISRAPLFALELWNLIRLCVPCHTRVYGRELRWRNRFYRLTLST